MPRARPKISRDTEAKLLAANRHTCCICEEPRKHVQIHHIDSNSANNHTANLAVVCLDCHSRVTGNEGLGRRFTEDEVRMYKARWESTCARDTGGGGESDDEEPISTDVREFIVRPGEHKSFHYELDEGELLLASVESNVPVDVTISSERKYKRWEGDDEIQPDELVEDHLRADIEFVAPRDGTYVVWVENDDDEIATIGWDVSIWAPDDEEA